MIYPNIGDEILSVNGKPFQGLTHNEAINVFKHIKTGEVVILVGRRNVRRKLDTTVSEEIKQEWKLSIQMTKSII